MSEVRRSAVPHHVVPWQNGRVVRWLLATDHKQVGILTVLTGIGFLVLTTALSLVVRAQLTVTNGDIVSRKVFAELVTMNGTTLLFLVALPLVLGLSTDFTPLWSGQAPTLAREMPAGSVIARLVVETDAALRRTRG